ncbi:hypothetical protein EDB83DRAFT_2323383 [Lactarius deliciosus]|nr:hypothetical protein EDB83DRAFT_2323383 [Lactarius deliciosus]
MHCFFSWYQLVQAKKSYGKGTSTTVMVAVAVAMVIGSWGQDHIVPHRVGDHKGLEALVCHVGTCMVGQHGGRAGQWGGSGVAWHVVVMVLVVTWWQVGGRRVLRVVLEMLPQQVESRVMVAMVSRGWGRGVTWQQVVAES